MFETTAGYVCDSCFEFSDEETTVAIQRVSELLELMAKNDDVYVPEGILRNLVRYKDPDVCGSRKQAQLWIDATVQAGMAVLFDRGKQKNLVCLCRYEHEARLPFPPEDTDTSAQEHHVAGLLWSSDGGWLKKTVVIDSLRANFENMKEAFMRNRVFINAHARKKFFVGKSPYGHTVALTDEDSKETLRFLLPLSKVALSPGSSLSEGDINLNRVHAADEESSDSSC
jgi:hypothetical protein